MDHAECKRILPEAETAYLFIHGIAGTPRHFDPLLSLIPSNSSVWNLLLDGHGKGVSDFSATSMKKWETQVRVAVDELSANHRAIYIIAHSMGTLLSIEQAIRCPKIKGLFLLAVPLKLSIKPRLMSNCIKVYFDRIRPDDHWALAAKACYGIGRYLNLLKYLGWLPRYLELFTKIRQIRKILEHLSTPCSVYQSAKDEMVSIRSLDLLRKNPHMDIHTLDCAGHFYYPEDTLNFLKEEIQAYFDQGGI